MTPRSNQLDHNEQLAIRWLDLISAGDIDGLARLVSASWRMYGGPPNLPAGRAGLVTLFETIGPVDQTWTVDDVIAEGDRVVVRATNSCTQDNFYGVPGTGVRQVFTATFTFRIVDGQIVETWRNADDLGRLLQLGARIVAGQATAAIV